MTKNPVPFLSSLSKVNMAVIIAFQKGYRIIDGKPYNPKKETLRINYQNDNQYMRARFSVKIGRDSVNVYAHKLMAFQKFGFCIFIDGMQIRHLDGNSLNNHAENIEIGSQSENMMDRPSEERSRIAINASKRSRKLPNKQIEEARSLRAAGWTYKKLMHKFNIKSKGTMHHILNHKYLS